MGSHATQWLAKARATIAQLEQAGVAA
jgi:hypothetical protein